LQEQLGVPVVPVVAAKGEGIAELKAAIARAVPAPLPLFDLPIPMRHQITHLAEQLHDEPQMVHQNRHVLAERLLVHDETDDIQALLRQPRLAKLIGEAQAELARDGIDPTQADIEAHYGWIDRVSAASLEPACTALVDERADAINDAPLPALLPFVPRRTFTDRLDRILLHKVWG